MSSKQTSTNNPLFDNQIFDNCRNFLDENNILSYADLLQLNKSDEEFIDQFQSSTDNAVYSQVVAFTYIMEQFTTKSIQTSKVQIYCTEDYPLSEDESTAELINSIFNSFDEVNFDNTYAFNQILNIDGGYQDVSNVYVVNNRKDLYLVENVCPGGPVNFLLTIPEFIQTDIQQSITA